MKKILILFLLCGLNLPTFVQAAEAVALDEALSSAFREAVDGGLGDDFTAALRTVLGKDNGAELLNTIKSSPAFKKMMAGMDSVGGDLLTPEARAAALKAATTTALKQMSRDFKPLTGETETAAIKRFTEGFGKETGAMRTEMLGNMEDSALAVLEQKMVGQDRAEVALQIQALNKAFTDFKAGTKNAFSEFRSVDTSAMEPAINRLAENVEGPLAKLGGGQALKDSQSAAVEDGGRDDLVVTAGANSTQKGFFTRLGNRASSYVKTKWGDFREEANTAAGLTDKIGARAKDIEALESMQARTTAFIDRNAQGQLEISSAAFNRTDVDKDALESFFKEGRGVVKFDSSGTEIETTTESVMKNADGSFTIKIRCVAGGNVDGDSFTYIVKNPSQEETRIFGTMADRERSDLAGSGKFFLSKTGKLRFISSTEFGEGFEGRLADLRKQIVSAKEELTDLTAQRKSQEYAYQKFNRTVISFVKALPDVILSPIKTLGKLWDQVIGIFKHLMEVGKMILQGVFFGIPSMIYQALMQAAQTAALYQQITAPVQVSGNFWLQIPTFLIPRTNPNSGTFLYVAVPAGGYDFGNDGSDSFLQTASYYVLYQEGAPWGQTYANSPNAPSGVWVNLNTGLIFTDGGNPANPQTPYAYLLQPVSATQVQAVQGAQPTLSVEEFIETIFDNVGSERTLVSFNQSWKDIDPFQIVPSSVSITVNPMLRKLFKSFTVTSGSGVTNFAVKVNNSTQVSESQKVYPAPLLTPTLNQFRNGIKNVRGFLPSTLKEANPVMSLKQFTGTGALNRLLGDPTVSVSPDNAVAILNEVKDATTALESAQQALATVLANPSQSSADLANALDALETAQTAFSTALNEVRVPGVGKPGMDPSYDVNGYSIYLYETEDTPIAQFLKANNPSALIPAKDYVLFLDENNTIVPIFEATLQTQKSGVTAIAYNTGQINSSIRYMCSLVTGLTYIYDENNPGSIALNGGIPDMSIASAAIGNLLQSIALVLYSSAPANDLINQVTAMANYATALAHEGPFIRNQRTLTRVDWDTFTNSTTAQQQRTQSFMSGLSGQQIAASSAIKQYSFGSPVSPAAQAAWLDCLYVYEVSGGPSRSSSASSSTGQSAPLPGCFGAVNGQPVYDYVVPLAQSATGAYQIMPLGVTEALGNVPIQGFAPVQALVSLVTGNLYDANYNLISGLTTVVKRTPDFNPIAALPGQPSVPWNQTVTVPGSNPPTTTTSTLQVAAVANVPLATAYMPTSYNPYNIIVTQVLNGGSNGNALAEQKTALTSATAALALATQAVTTLLTTQSLSSKSSNAWQAMEAYAKKDDVENVNEVFTSSQNLFSDTQVSLMNQWIDKLQDPSKGTVIADQLKASIHATFLPFDVWSYVQSHGNKQNFESANAAVQKYMQGAFAAFQEPMSNWITARQNLAIANNNFELVLAAYLKTYKPQPPFDVVRPSDQLLYVPPMYWMSFLNYAYFSLTASLNEYPVSFQLPNQQTGSASFNWLNLNANPQVNALGVSLGQAVPQAFVDEVKEAFLGWSYLQEQVPVNSDAQVPTGVASIMQAGPFQFTTNLASNVYLTILPADCQNDNFFYSAPSVFDTGDLCVLGELSSATAAAVTAALKPAVVSSTGAVSTVTTPSPAIAASLPSLTVDDCNANDHLGLSFYQIYDANRVLINLTTGNVWFQTPLVQADQEDASDNDSAMSNITCIGQLDPNVVLKVALQNQYVGTGTAQSQTLPELLSSLESTNPALYQKIKNNQIISGAQVQASLYPFYFAGKTLSLCKEQITNRTFIYAVTEYPGQPYLDANDYWVVVQLDSSGSFVPTAEQISGTTQYMMSLVSYLVYEANCAQPSYQTSQATSQGFVTITLSPLDKFNNFFAAGADVKGLTSNQVFASVSTNNSALYNRILELVTVSTQSFITSALLKGQSPTGILAAPLPTTLSKVTGIHINNLYQDPTSKKYFLYMPGATAADASYCYDFNVAEYAPTVTVNTTSSSGSLSYPSTEHNANRGVYYTVQTTSPAQTNTVGSGGVPTTAVLPDTLTISSSSPLSVLTGYPCQAMLVKYGISVDGAGNETLGLPVFNPPLPMTPEDTVLAPGQSSTTGYMQCVAILAPTTGVASQTPNTPTDYYYFNNEAQLYLVRRVVNTQIPVVVNVATGQTGIQIIEEDYYIDLMTGERYHVNGNPYLTDVTVAYYAPTSKESFSSVGSSSGSATGSATANSTLVENSALDYSNPLFMWGQLDVFGEPTQQSCMYQVLSASDPNFGYNEYQIRPNSTVFTTWTPSSGAGSTGATTSYSYQMSSTGTVSVAVTPSGGQATVMAGKTMQQLLLDAIKSGQFLLTKSYVMDLNGNPGSTAESSTITVTQTCAQPYCYQVSYETSTPTAATTGSSTGSSQTGANSTLTTGTAPAPSGNSAGSSSSNGAASTVTTTTATATGASTTGSTSNGANTVPSASPVVTIFQTPLPVTMQGAVQPGASSNSYNNPPLDAALQLQLVQGIPFCAQIIGSRPFQVQSQSSASGQEVAQLPLSPASAKGVSTLGLNPIVCGILSSPAHQTNYINDSGLLAATFAGTIQSSAASSAGTGAVTAGTTNQYFAYYGMANASSVGGTETAVGRFNFYSSVVANMNNLYPLNQYPGLYAANLTQQVLASQGSSESYLPTGAPYLSIVPLPGGQPLPANASFSSYTVPSSTATEYVYGYQYSTVSNVVLSQLKTIVNVTSNANGFMHLVSAVDPAGKATVSIAPGSQTNLAAQQVIKNQVGYYEALQSIVGSPQGRYLYELQSSVDGQSGYTTYPVYAFVSGLSAGSYYIDIVNGIVFQQQTSVNGALILYPAGYAISGGLLGLISQVIGNATPPSGAAAGELLIQKPGITSALTGAGTAVA